MPGGWYTRGTESTCPAGGSLEEQSLRAPRVVHWRKGSRAGFDMETAKAQKKGVRL